MSDNASSPFCPECRNPGVRSYLVLSPGLQYWRCPECFRVWTTRKTESERKHEQQRIHNLSAPDSGATARTHCPECRASQVLDLNQILYSSRADYFRCRACDCWWIVPKGKDGPATRMKFGKARTDRSDTQVG